MSAKRIEKDGLIFYLFEKSIQVNGYGLPIFFGEAPTEKHIDQLLMMVHIGEARAKKQVRDALGIKPEKDYF
jgi:hypothetical protein